MKTKININKKDIRNYTIVLIIGLSMGWLFLHNSEAKTETTHNHTEEVEEATTWTCSMHPQIRMDKPGQCPICSMDLIPLETSSSSDEVVDPNEIRMSESAMKLAEIQTMRVKKDYSNKEVYLLGRVKPDERNIAELTARFGGRIEKLFVNFTGQNVRKGEKLATIYSPELITAQKELLEAMEYKESNPAFYKATRNKLKLWDLTNAQIDGIEKGGEPQTYFDILSPISGTVTMRHVATGDYIKEGNALFQVVNLNKLWIMFEAFELDLPWLNQGDEVEFTVQSLPGEKFNGTVAFIDPFLDPKTRVAYVRVEVANPKLELKPEMFANGIIKPKISTNQKDLLIPKTSVLWTGKRSVVYVKVPEREQPTFKYREIVLGPEAGDFYIIKDGLKEGEEIAVNGVFKIDAAAQLEGKQSMMNPDGGKSSSGHHHAGMNIDKTNKNAKQEAEMVIHPEVDPAFRNQLTDFYVCYLKMTDAFIESNPDNVSETAMQLNKRLGLIDMELLEGHAHIKWMKYLKNIKNSLSEILKTNNIEEQRIAYSKLNETLYSTIKEFGLNDSVTAYYQYCPMAVENKGAYWFSNIKEIKNPYFGDMMLTCGETKEIINK